MRIERYIPIAVCACLAAFFCWFPITDTDIFWHLAAGREIVRTGHFLHSDPFSFTNALPEWTDIHWLFQVFMYGLYTLGGLKALVVFKLLAVAATCVLLCGAVRSRRYAYSSTLVCAFFFYQARYLVCERPILITMLCIAAYIFLFERVGRATNGLLLWLCVPLQLLWANSQSLYPLGIFVIGAYWVEDLLSFFWKKGGAPIRTTALLIAGAASCTITPYGWRAVVLPFKLFADIAPTAHSLYSLNISENVPLLALSGYDAMYRAAVIVAALAACILFFLNGRRVRASHVVLFAGFLFLAYSAERNVPLFFLVLVPILGCGVMGLELPRQLAEFIAPRKRHISAAAVACGVVILAVPVSRHAAVVSLYPPHRTLSPFRFPEKIASYLEEHPIPGEMFNDIRYGGYLIWRLYPKKKVFTDGRIMIRSPKFFADYLAICKNPGLFPFAADKFNLTHAIVPSAVFPQYRGLIRFLYHSPDWHLEYTDGTSFLIVKNGVSKRPAIDLSDPHAVASIADGIRVGWSDAPYVRREALGYFAEELADMGLTASAKQVRESERNP
jgi:hypothetical protein